VIADSRGRAAAAKLFNNAAQAWNHTYFWAAMSPRRTSPGAVLALAIDQNAGGLAGLKQTFVAEGAAHFGSGWVWVFAEGDIVKVRTTHDAETMADSASTTPLLVCDLWEHAYYLDHKQDREGFLTAWFDALPNWDLATAQFEAAGGRGGAWRHPVPTQVGT
jgi:Fe-Mn family superoxide dismutase